MTPHYRTALALLVVAVAVSPWGAQAHDPRLHVATTAHLDTQWRWTVRDTINTFLPNTVTANEHLFERYPYYCFSFEGSYRYRLLEQYHPELFARVQQHVKDGRWALAGCGLDAIDTIMPAPESLVRHLLYSQRYFVDRFGHSPEDILLPDCFGFSGLLPDIALHCRMRGFSTQKLTWGSAVGIPFKFGIWEGFGGSSLPAVLHGGSYVDLIREDLSASPFWIEHFAERRAAGHPAIGFRYFGTGDQGGAPDEGSVAWLKAGLDRAGPIAVHHGPSDALFKSLVDTERAALPRYRGELLMTDHGTGCYTSQRVLKQWNRENERLAAAAERASVVADWLGTEPYPAERLRHAWRRFMWHQFHDGITGTSIPAANAVSWDDLSLARNVFSHTLRDAVRAWGEALDTETEGEPLLVYNPLGFAREEPVEARVRARGDVSVFDSTGEAVPTQILRREGPWTHLLFLARVPPLGLAVYEARERETSEAGPNALSVSASSLADDQFTVRWNAQGSVTSILDRVAHRELLSGPCELIALEDSPSEWPEWEIDYDDISATPAFRFDEDVQIRVAERGPVRASVVIERGAGNSRATQILSLQLGNTADGLSVRNVIDWRSPGHLLKASFPFSPEYGSAHYHTGLGTVARATNTPSLYEVPAQRWAELRGENGAVALMTDSLHGFDHPSPGLLRASLLRTPVGTHQDLGRHDVTWAIAPRDAARSPSRTRHLAEAHEAPMLALTTTRHSGALGRVHSIYNAASPDLELWALKQSENGEGITLRLATAKAGNAPMRFGLKLGVSAIHASDGTETEMQAHADFDFHRSDGPIQTFILTADPASSPLGSPSSSPVECPYDSDLIAEIGEAGLEPSGAFPADSFPRHLRSGRVDFELAPADAPNAVSAAGQSIALPTGTYRSVHLLAAVWDGDLDTTIEIAEQSHALRVPALRARIAHPEIPKHEGARGIFETQAGQRQSARIAWHSQYWIEGDGTRRVHTPVPLFHVSLPYDGQGGVVTLPNTSDLKVFAISVSQQTVPSEMAIDGPLHATRVSPAPGTDVDFLVTTALSLIPEPTDAEIRYTTDGSRPDTASPRYEGPIALDRSSLVRARAFHPDLTAQHELILPLRAHRPVPSQRLWIRRKGLRVDRHEGEWTSARQVESGPHVSRITLSRAELPPDAAGDNYGLIYRGWIYAPETGLYLFATRSDDGSILNLGGRDVVLNDGRHAPLRMEGQIALKRGWHSFRLDYLEASGGEMLEVTWRRPGSEEGPIPSRYLKH